MSKNSEKSVETKTQPSTENDIQQQILEQLKGLSERLTKLEKSETKEKVKPVNNDAKNDDADVRTSFNFDKTHNVASLTDSYFEHSMKAWVKRAVGSNYRKDDDVDAVIHKLMQYIDCINAAPWDAKKIDDREIVNIKVPTEITWLIQPQLIRWQTTDSKCADLSLKATKPDIIFNEAELANIMDRIYKWFKRGNQREPGVDLTSVRKEYSIENVLDFFIGEGYQMTSWDNLDKWPINVGSSIMGLYTTDKFIDGYQDYIDALFSNDVVGMKLGVITKKQS